MWNRASFRDGSAMCTMRRNGRPTVLIRPGPIQTIAWYQTKRVHEPIVSAWSEVPEDAATVDAIALSGMLRARP
jgi:hypothetical protein